MDYDGRRDSHWASLPSLAEQSMLIIKRYPNRKLYDTAAKQYVSLERIAEMIRAGAEVQVLDHATGEDLTTLILMQVIVERERQHTGFLPLAVLTGLVQAGGNTLSTLRRSLAAPLDLLHQADEEIARRIDVLVGLGELAEEEGRRLIGLLLDLGAGYAGGETAGPNQIERMLRARGLPSRSEVRALAELVDDLTAEVEALHTAQDHAGEAN